MKKNIITAAIALFLATFAQAKLYPDLPPHLPQRGELTEFQKTLDGDILVTEDNFLAAEADRYLAEQQELAPVNQWEHKFKLLTYKTQSVVRQNRDTLYSKSIVDVSKGATFSVEKSDQYQTLHVIDSNHREILVLYSDSNERTKTIDMSDLSKGAGEHVYVVLRTAMPNGESPEAYKVANKLQRSAKIKANSAKPYVPKGFDQESREATRLALEPKLLTFDIPNAFGTVGAKNVTKYDATVGVGIGWGGFSTEHAHYKILIPEDRSGAPQTMTFDAPKFKKGGFFSITTYGPSAYIQADKYAINMNEMEPNKDGTYTVNFNRPGEKNNLEVMKGWTGALRMYRPIDKASIIEFAKGVEAPHGVKATIKTHKASCRCGKLTVTYTGPVPERRTLCHCNSCQLRTGTAFSIQGRFPREKVKIEGKSTKWTFPNDEGPEVTYRSCDSGGATFHFCPVCGTTVYWDIAAAPDIIGIAIGTLTDPTFPPPVISGFEAYGHPWAMKAADLPIIRLEYAE